MGSSGRSRRATIVDVARSAGVSVASASKVMRDAPGTSDAMRERVLQKVAELGYRPHRLAQGMRGPLKTVGFLLPDIENPYFGLIVRGAGEVFAAVGYEIFIAPAGTTSETHRNVMESLIDHNMAGLLLVAPRGSSDQLEAVSAQVPVVVLGRHGPGRNYDTVAGDDIAGATALVGHLVGQGHRRIAYLANDADADDPRLLENMRLEGYRSAMIQHGLRDSIDVIYGDWTDAGGRSATPKFLDRPVRPTAIFAGADVSAIGMLGELWDRGFAVPEDIAVVGYDNSPASALKPISLTSVDQSGREAGRLAAQLLLDRIHGRVDPQDRLLVPSLVARKTSDGTILAFTQSLAV